jgi:hypothetical protein
MDAGAAVRRRAGAARPGPAPRGERYFMVMYCGKNFSVGVTAMFPILLE